MCIACEPRLGATATHGTSPRTDTTRGKKEDRIVFPPKCNEGSANSVNVDDRRYNLSFLAGTNMVSDVDSHASGCASPVFSSKFDVILQAGKTPASRATTQWQTNLKKRNTLGFVINISTDSRYKLFELLTY